MNKYNWSGAAGTVYGSQGKADLLAGYAFIMLCIILTLV